MAADARPNGLAVVVANLSEACRGVARLAVRSGWRMVGSLAEGDPAIVTSDALPRCPLEAALRVTGFAIDGAMPAEQWEPRREMIEARGSLLCKGTHRQRRCGSNAEA